MKMIVDEKTEDLILLLSPVKTIIQNIKKKKNVLCEKLSHVVYNIWHYIKFIVSIHFSWVF